jgi:hypothetical protein
METKLPAKGQIVRTCYGEIKTVADAYGCVVLFTDGDWAHPTKVFPVGQVR